MSSTSYAVLASLPILVWYLYYLLSQWRFKKFAHIPGQLPSNLFLGHLGYMIEGYKKLGSSLPHPDYVLEEIWKDNGRPEFMLLDTRPTSYPLALITSHELAEQVSRATKANQYSVTKSPTMQEGFGRLVGKYSMLSENHDSWKALRKRFNPGFAPQHLLSLLPVIVEKTEIFLHKLDALAESGVETEMEPLCTDVTFDIIGEVITNIDCKAQGDAAQGDEIVRNFRKLIPTYAADNGLNFTFLNVPLQIKRFIYGRQLDSAVKKCISQKFIEIKSTQTTEKKSTKDRSVLALALHDVDVLTPYILQSTADQVKSFLFAGHDTTSILLQRLFYALSIHPTCLAKVRAEHDAIFGSSNPRDVLLARPEETIKALVYTSACIKEALRLWPPAGSARMSHNGFKIRTSDGDEVCLDKCVIYLCQHIIHRDAKVYGEMAEDFVPERWTGDVNTGATDSEQNGPGKIPSSAWRPFERGPRNCIGQELSNLEARVILACVVRRYDFVKVGVGEVEVDGAGQPVMGEKGKYKTKSELFSTMSITSKPMDQTRMRVKFHGSPPS
ncbi:cytochrome P450 [Dothidotthia symphoricarpi CBS 119687]|uniref:Cytochrome P450 n=1 Tax=Dothidotthia symphoricarpi CBS 119687 TaxID=1392245 RepID=A0A6A6ATR4_9PLEO|nr:cytochrome P450 [Dothidotthia symphoricarpi CBS 119687]KAF2134227.1 cytochrome P450 [Dothidotthia symphoricarpi CBS 119687]